MYVKFFGDIYVKLLYIVFVKGYKNSKNLDNRFLNFVLIML